MAFEKTWNIYVGDTDCFGLIYTPVVVDYIVRTLEDFRKEMEFPIEIRPDSHVIAPARNVNVNYEGNIRPNDDLTITLQPNVGTTSITYDITGKVQDEVVVEGELTCVYVNTADNQPTPVPDEIRERISGE
jgi:acyl-CoA thioesterase FadM